MKKICLLIAGCSATLLSFGQAGKTSFAIIPQPAKIIAKKGNFVLQQHIIIEAVKTADVKLVTDFLKNKLTGSTGVKVAIKGNSAAPATIKLLLLKKPDTALGKEGYHLLVSKKGVIIKANEPAGLFYGAQTLIQLLPKEIEGLEVAHGVVWTVPCVDIKDYPRFGWRGLMLDVSRHFFTKDEVKQYIDQMARYKFNLLHMHLTDDDGWRIEIKSLPLLTSVGGFNVKKVGEFGTFSAPTA